MDDIRDDGTARQLSNVSWRRSRYSGATGNCVEVAPLGTGDVAVRNSRFPNGPVLIYTRDEMAAFLSGARAGEFDDVVDQRTVVEQGNRMTGVGHG
jgi:hypothetical protein